MNIWVPKLKVLEPKHELVLPSNRVSGHFKIEGRLDDGRRRSIADWQPNLILDAGLERWGTGTIISHCCVGSDNTPPVAADSALVTHVASTTVSYTNANVQASAPYYGWRVFTAVFSPPGSDRNLSEIGIGWATGGASLFSRALIKDSGGTPTTISWLAAETLIVTWEMRNYPWLVDVEVTTTISGANYNLIMRASDVDYIHKWMFRYQQMQLANQYANQAASPGYTKAFSGAIGLITDIPSSPSGTAASGTWGTDAAYVPGSYKRTNTISWGPTLANFAGGIEAVEVITGAGSYQIDFDPALPKTSVDTLTLNLSTPVWGRYA